MTHYVGVFVPREPDGWRALFPDFPSCVAEGPNLEIAILRAADALSQHVGSANGDSCKAPPPQGPATIKFDQHWATTHGISFQRAIISMIPLRGFDAQQRGRDVEWPRLNEHLKRTSEAALLGTVTERSQHRAG